ncbi:DUF4126 family protein [Puniceicoccaceae bacterium K14]|nr:DUF4126 family protein [Puniceicoccaceae bacterium K14]
MNLNSLLYSLGLSGFFSSRAFLPAFLTALALRFGDTLPFLKDLDFVKATGGEPTWFTSNAFLLTLGALSLAEFAADKSPDVRRLMEDFMGYVKAGLSALTTMGMVSVGDAEVIGDLMQEANIFQMIPAAVSATVTYFATTIRGGVLSFLDEADEDDELGIRGIISWFEDLWATWGVWLLAFYITGVLAINVLILAALWLLQRRFAKKAEEAKVECSSCGERIHSFSTQCFNCSEPVKTPVVLGFLGRHTQETNTDIEGQKLRLLELKRSPLSGEKVKKRGVDIVCPEDGIALLGDKSLNRKYVDNISSRLPKVLLFGALWGLIPAVGLIVGVIYYRFQLVGPFRRYLTFKQGFLVKWLIRLLFIALALFQLVPGAGAVSVPLMAWISFLFYKGAFTKALTKGGLL